MWKGIAVFQLIMGYYGMKTTNKGDDLNVMTEKVQKRWIGGTTVPPFDDASIQHMLRAI